MSEELKVVVIGDTSSEKTCLIYTYTSGSDPNSEVPTVFDNYTKKLTINGKSIDMTLWDTDPSDDLDEMRPLSYSETDCFVVCFALDDKEGFERVKSKWIPEINNNCDNAKIVLFATKSEVKETKEVISNKQIEELKNQINVIDVFECSALKQTGLDEAFEFVAKVGAGMVDNTVQKQQEKKGGFFSKLFGKKK